MTKPITLLVMLSGLSLAACDKQSPQPAPVSSQAYLPPCPDGHHCIYNITFDTECGQKGFQVYDPDNPDDAKLLECPKPLSEDRVREIVREEINK
jgi:hypothetical protein